MSIFTAPSPSTAALELMSIRVYSFILTERQRHAAVHCCSFTGGGTALAATAHFTTCMIPQYALRWSFIWPGTHVARSWVATSQLASAFSWLIS
jgi:hypothetical protein